jgi:hypothetical protein
MTNYEHWRESEIKKVGAPLQHKAEEKLDKRDHMSFIEVVNEETGKTEKYKEDVADVYLNRKTHSRKRLTFTVPDIPGFTS